MTGQVLTVVEVLRRAQGFLAQRGVDTPRLDAELMLADILGCDRLSLYTGFDRPLTTAERDAFRATIGRRARREPVAYIIGRRGFRNLVVQVDDAVLIPRPETELLVDWAIEVAPQGGAVLDWGTGSGAIALALAQERPDLTLTGLDRSAAALAVARRNDPHGQVEWLLSDGYGALGERRFDVIVANPPYIATGEFAELAPELAHEPREALVSGPTGLECYRSLTGGVADHLAPGGHLLVEIGATQGPAVAAMFIAAGLTDVATRADLAGLPRVVGGRR